MKWYKSYFDFDRSPFMGEIIAAYGAKGFLFWKWNLSLMTEHFDSYNPGCNKFLWDWFILQFPSIKDRRSIAGYLDFFQKRLELFSIREARHVLLYCPRLEKWADEYTLKVIAENARNDKKIPFDNFLSDRMKKHADQIELEVLDAERERNSKK